MWVDTIAERKSFSCIVASPSPAVKYNKYHNEIVVYFANLSKDVVIKVRVN